MLKFANRNLVAGMTAIAIGFSALIATSVPASTAQNISSDVQSAASLAVVIDFLSNTAPDKVEAAAKRLVAPDATYVSLNFNNPELKKIEPWTGTAKGPSPYSSTFMRVAN